jgi:hypothetical protein
MERTAPESVDVAVAGGADSFDFVVVKWKIVEGCE